MFCHTCNGHLKVNPSKTSAKFIISHPEAQDLINEARKTLQDSSEDSVAELIYRVINNISEKPVCPVCGSPVSFHSFPKGYASICSSHCNMKSQGNIANFKKSVEKKNPYDQYDFSHANEQTDQFVLSLFIQFTKKGTPRCDGNKMALSGKWASSHPEIYRYLSDRFPDTTNLSEIIYRLFNHIETPPVCQVCGNPVKFINFQVGYQRCCCQSCALRHPDTQAKIKETNDRLNSENPDRKRQIREKAIKTYKDNLHKRVLEQHTTIRTAFISKAEKELYDILTSLYGEDQIDMHFYDKRYGIGDSMFECDFYVRPLDLFIECQAFPTHGGHPFCNNCKEDQDKVLELKEKSRNLAERRVRQGKDPHNIYDDTLSIWCKTDPLKRKVAKDNCLNYLEVFDQHYDLSFVQRLINEYFSLRGI